MDIADAVGSRQSIRAYKPDPVPHEVLREIMELSLRAPSWSNVQPWEFVVVSGKKLEEIKQAHLSRAEEPPHPDLAAPREFPEPYNTRRRALGIKLFEAKGIGREDREARRQWRLQGLKFFGAPCAIFILIDRAFYFQGDALNIWPLFDCGMVAENIILLAAKYGLGTVPEIQAVFYPEVLRKMLAIPESKLIVLGIAIGYPDWDDPVNKFRSERDPLDEVIRWHGFEPQGE
jgi:nitroreductase